MPVGQYSDRLAIFWNRHLPTQSMADLDGRTGAYAAPMLAHAVCALLQDAHGYSRLPTAFEGEYEEATMALATLWQACREYPEYIVSLNY